MAATDANIDLTSKVLADLVLLPFKEGNQVSLFGKVDTGTNTLDLSVIWMIDGKEVSRANFETVVDLDQHQGVTAQTISNLIGFSWDGAGGIYASFRFSDKEQWREAKIDASNTFFTKPILKEH